MDSNQAKTKRSTIVKTIAFTGIMAALASVLMFLEFPLFFIAPDFLKFDFSGLPALIVSFVLGPVHGVVVVAIKNLVHLTVSQTLGVGELADFIIGGIFVFSAGFVYRLSRTKKGALVGMVYGTLVMSAAAAFLNYFLLIPFFANLFIAAPIDASAKLAIIVDAFGNVFPAIDNLFKAVLFSVVPFNLIKGIVISIITFIVYKKISNVFKT